MKYKGFTLDKFQEDAIAAIEANNSVVVSAPTGSGKTLIADYIINRDVQKRIRVIYTAPIKALSNQKYKEFIADYGPERVGIMTGDTVINPDAQIIVMTTEIYRNMILTEDPSISDVSYVIFDEIHYINDPERGYVWEESIIFSPEHVRFLCLSATIPNAEEFASWIEAIKKHKVEVIRHEIRSVPLNHQFYDEELGITTLSKIKQISEIPEYEDVVRVRRGKRKNVRVRKFPRPDHVKLLRLILDKLPCIFFNFSRKSCQQKATELYKSHLFNYDKEISSILVKKFSKMPVEVKRLAAARLLRETLPYGIGFHHAGLLPILKDVVEDLFAMGKIKVLYATETFAVGINMPAKAVCFESLRKFDGIEFRMLNSKEYFQIAGRAGRRGIDEVGYAISMINRRDLEYSKTKSITTKDVLPIKSQFKLSINTILNLIKNHKKEDIHSILKMSFYSYQKYGAEYDDLPYHMMHRIFERKKKKLQKLHFLEGDQLTEKGEFASQIYSDEIAFGELFETSLTDELEDYEMFLLIAVLVMESHDRVEFLKTFDKKAVKRLQRKLYDNDVLRNDKRFDYLEAVTAFARPIFDGLDFFKILDNSSMPEGDLIRYLRRIIDKVDQIKRATKRSGIRERMEAFKRQVWQSMEGIDTL